MVDRKVILKQQSFDQGRTRIFLIFGGDETIDLDITQRYMVFVAYM